MYADDETDALSKNLEYVRGSGRGVRDHGHTGKELLRNGDPRFELEAAMGMRTESFTIPQSVARFSAECRLAGRCVHCEAAVCGRAR